MTKEALRALILPRASCKKQGELPQNQLRAPQPRSLVLLRTDQQVVRLLPRVLLLKFPLRLLPRIVPSSG